MNDRPFPVTKRKHEPALERSRPFLFSQGKSHNRIPYESSSEIRRDHGHCSVFPHAENRKSRGSAGRHPRQPDAQQQEEEKDIPVITNPAVFNEKDLDKLLEKQREYIKKHYPDYKIVGEGQEQDYFDSRNYSRFELENEDEEWVLTIRFDIEEAYQAYMKQHQKEIEREAARLIREGLIKIE